MSDQEIEIVIAPSYKAGETLGTVTIKDCKFVNFECANCACLTAELEALRADALRYRWLREHHDIAGPDLDESIDNAIASKGKRHD